MNDFTKTGIEGKTVAWGQDVEPKLYTMREELGLDLKVVRRKIDNALESTVYLNGKYVFKTTVLSSLWMWLRGIEMGMSMIDNSGLEEMKAALLDRCVLVDKIHEMTSTRNRG